MNRTHEGTGLGLAIVKSYAELHGAKLEIESTPGEGTTVTVRFPKRRTVTPPPQPAPAVQSPPGPDTGAAAQPSA